MIFEAIMKGLALYNKLNSFFIFRWFPSFLRSLIIARTKYNIVASLANIRSLNSILYEYATFLRIMRCEYDSFSPRKTYSGVRTFSITYTESERKNKEKYISRVKCIIVAPQDLTIVVKCSYNFSDVSVKEPNILGCFVSFRDTESEYTVSDDGLNEFYNELFDYIEENIIHDSMLVFVNYVIMKDSKA